MLNNFKIGTKIGASFALGLAIFTTIGLSSYRSTTQLIETSRWQNHTYQVLGELEELASQLKEAESEHRGYLITGDKSYLVSYNAALKVIKTNINDLRKLTADNPNQQRRIDRLKPLIDRRFSRFQEIVNLRDQKGINAILQTSTLGKGREIMNDIRQVLNEMEAEENALLKQRSAQAKAATQETIQTITYGIPFSFVVLTLIGFFLTRNISKPLKKISNVAERFGTGDLSISVPDFNRSDEIGVLTQTFNQMIANLRDSTQKNNEQSWLKSNLAQFTQLLQGQRNLETVSQLILSELAPLVGAQQGVFYVMDSLDNQPLLKLLSSYAYQERKHLANQFRLGEGLVGQCALEKEKIILTQVPSDYIKISSGLGEATPQTIIVLPVLFETQVTAVIELASFQRFSEIHLTFLDQVTDSIGILLNTIASDLRTQELLKQSQSLAQELQTQQEELKTSNKRLEQQTQSLQASEDLLRQQQEELQQSNEELQQLNASLEEKTELLSLQNSEVERKNREIEQARQSVEEKAKQLALTSKYKSEFLANMSHELRTPLNSLLILSKLMSDNTEGNLSEKQVEYIRTIHASGTDLLGLINDILEIAKIESGTMSVDIDLMLFTDLRDSIERTFRQVAQDKRLKFTVEFDEKLPRAIYTDSKRLQQVLMNLLSNAFKFTERGQVTLRVEPVTRRWSPNQDTLSRADTVVAFSVSDTGIGIAANQQKIVFEAFQQADGSTSRRYGGTGLGLSISREIAQLLDGEIQLVSTLGQGSTFTLYLPQRSGEVEELGSWGGGKKQEPSTLQPSTLEPSNLEPSTLQPLSDDRDEIQPGDRILLIIEDDINFARVLLDLVRQQGFKGLVALKSDTGLAMAREFKPDAITLDILMPVMDGWTVLDRLKHDPTTRHIPVHIVSADEGRQRSLQQGAIAYLQKPVSSEVLTEALSNIKNFIDRKVKKLLVVEDNETQRQSLVELIGNSDVCTTAVGTGAAALSALKAGHFDCLVLDLGLPDMTGFELIEQIKQDVSLQKLPIIIYTGKELTKQEETELKRIADTIIIKDVRSPERLLDETALFLHRIQANLPPTKQQILEKLHQKDPVLTDKKVLIVDDDVRNIFALTSLLERHQMQILYAENGREGLDVLQNTSDIDVVLMDVMMPEMDGYETTRAIRQMSQFARLPIIALTAKAMKGDREKCIEAGASDYITKPVEPEQLLSLLRVWLYR